MQISLNHLGHTACVRSAAAFTQTVHAETRLYMPKRSQPISNEQQRMDTLACQTDSQTAVAADRHDHY